MTNKRPEVPRRTPERHHPRPAAPHAPTVGRHDPGGAPSTFDYAFVSADLAPRVRSFRIGDLAHGSEHQPLLLELS